MRNTPALLSVAQQVSSAGLSQPTSKPESPRSSGPMVGETGSPLPEATQSPAKEIQTVQLQGTEEQPMATIALQETVALPEGELLTQNAAGASWVWIGFAILVAASVAAAGMILHHTRGKRHKPTTLYTEQDSPQPPRAEDSGWLVSAAQSLGTRKKQEDALCYSNHQQAAVVKRKGFLAAVADGIGGMDDGQVASTAVARQLLSDFRGLEAEPGSSVLLALFAAAQQTLLRMNETREGRCGCTLVCTLIADDQLHFLSVGDSRIYLLRDGGLIQLNREHVLGARLDESETPPQAGQKRNALTAYMGKVDLQLVNRTTAPVQLFDGDRILLMSDGVFGTLPEERIVQALEGEPLHGAERIIRLVDTQEKKHQDNATVVVITKAGGQA